MKLVLYSCPIPVLKIEEWGTHVLFSACSASWKEQARFMIQEAWLYWLRARPFTPILNSVVPRVLGIYGFKFSTAVSLVYGTFFVDGHIL